MRDHESFIRLSSGLTHSLVSRNFSSEIVNRVQEEARAYFRANRATFGGVTILMVMVRKSLILNQIKMISCL